MKSLIVAATITILSLIFSASAFALANISLIAAPDGKTWTLQASNFENVSGVSIGITYDKTVLANPKISQGAFLSGAMLASNPKQPGVINIAVVTTQSLNGSGPIATITFEKKSAGEPKFVITPRVIGANLSATPVTTGEITTTDTTTRTDGSQPGTGNNGVSGSGSGNVGGSGTTSPTVVGGTVTLPSDLNAQPEEKKPQQPPGEYKEEPLQETRTAAREAATPEPKPQETEIKSVQIKVVPPESVLGRFKAYKGELTTKALMTLFTSDEKATAKQDPKVLLADGKVNLKVTVQNPQGKHAPNFALKKAKLVNLKMTAESDWVVIAKPVKDVYEASITMLMDDATVEIPLTVAPKVDIDLDKSGKVDDSDFKLFLKDRGSEKAPKHDLNKDGRRDYIDDYIFIANYLVLQPKKPVPSISPENSPGSKQKVVPAGKQQTK